MKKKIIFLWIVLIFFLFPVSGDSLPYSEIAEFKTSDDQYTKILTLPVFVTSGSTYVSEDRVIQIRISPGHFAACYDDEGYLYEDKDIFFKVLVSISLSGARGVSQEFRSYLNHSLDDCDEQAWEGHLFFDHADEVRADQAGKTFDSRNPLTVKDGFFVVTLSLMDVKKSNYGCENNDEYCLDCETDAACIIFVDSLTVKVDISYSSTQLEYISLFEKASQHTASAQESFQAGEFDEAKSEFVEAQSFYDELGDEEKSQVMQEQIDMCIAYTTGQENMTEGIRLFQEASATDDYDEAIKIYEDALSYFEAAKAEFDEINSAQSAECQTMINQCNDEIENLKGVGRLRTRLLYFVVGIAVLGGAGVVYKQIQKGKGAKPPARGITLRVQHADTGKEVSISVERFDKIGKVRQLAGTKLGILPSDVLYNGKFVPPDQTVAEAGLSDGAVIKITTVKAPEKVKKKGVVYCPECGTENPEKSAFCGKCGAKLT